MAVILSFMSNSPTLIRIYKPLSRSASRTAADFEGILEIESDGQLFLNEEGTNPEERMSFID